ncbi:MFS multidrug transporter [Aspergillus sclerotioniger CBS 115572]|uniref:MFS multidrug transporter n=1 Tax=Aspergillus sclerotioniger CBS 115572 TaxID=1450535 RepID=A0A317X932_9EURO|nr:MFS multidrug transporter [Aspergillus sclerotioniger CBS 115572]PWY94107.1 MFS multidrug transporter [Aspergillus sclerotioniger CBS 115572]
MGAEYIEFSHAKNGLESHPYNYRSSQNLVEVADAERLRHNAAADLRTTEWKPGVKEWLVLTCVSLLMTMDAFNATVVLPLVTNLSTTSEQPLGSALWIEATYFLASAASQSFSAMLAALFGVGPIGLGAAVLATVGTGVCSGSMNLACLVPGRFIQGMGCGGVLATSLLMIDEVIPCPHQARFTGYIFQARVAGATVGLIFGGVLIDHAVWAFYISFVFCALGLLVIPFAVDLRSYKHAPKYKTCELDWQGAALTFMGIGCLLIGINWGGTLYDWSNWHVLVLLGAGGASMLVLVLYEVFWAVHPIFSSIVFNSIARTMLYLGSLLHGFLISCHILNCSLYLKLVKDLSSALEGLSLVTIASPALLLLILIENVRLLRSPSLPPWMIRAGWMCSTLATGFFIILDPATPHQIWVFIFLGMGVGHSLLISGYHKSMHSITSNRKSSSGESSGRDSGHSSSCILMYSVLRTWGMCIAVPVSGAIVFNRMLWEVKEGGANSDTQTGDTSLSEQGRVQKMMLVHGFHILWRVMVGVSALGGLSSLFVR